MQPPASNEHAKRILDDRNLVKSLRYDSQFYKTKLCMFFQSGRCSRKFCKFAHGMDELQSAPDLRKTAMCKAFMTNGFCDREDCSFAHSLDELRATDKFYKTTMCCFHYYGSCKLGNLCRHAHSKEELRSLPDMPGLPEELAAAMLSEAGSVMTRGTYGDPARLQVGPRQPGPQLADTFSGLAEEMEVLKQSVLEGQMQMRKLKPNDSRLPELQRKEHQNINRLQQITELQTLRRYHASALQKRQADNPGMVQEQQLPMEQQNLLLSQKIQQQKLQQQQLQEQLQEQLQQHQKLQDHLKQSQMPLGWTPPGALQGLPGPPKDQGRGQPAFNQMQFPDSLSGLLAPTLGLGPTGPDASLLGHLSQMPMLAQDLPLPDPLTSLPFRPEQLPGFGVDPLSPATAMTQMMSQVPNLRDLMPAMPQPREASNALPLSQQPLHQAMGSQAPAFPQDMLQPQQLFQQMNPPQPPPLPQALPQALPQVQPQVQPQRPQQQMLQQPMMPQQQAPQQQAPQQQAPQRQAPQQQMQGGQQASQQMPLQMQPQLLQPNPGFDEMSSPKQLPMQRMPAPQAEPPIAQDSGPKAAADSQKEFHLLQQQIQYHQHMQQKMEERMQKLKELGQLGVFRQEGGNQQMQATVMEEDEDEDDLDSLGPIPGWSREGSLREPVRNMGMAQPAMGAMGSSPKRLSRAIDESKELDEEDDLGEDPNWVRVRTMPPTVGPAAKAQALRQHGAPLPTGMEHQFSPSVASTADTAADRPPKNESVRSEPEECPQDDPGGDDLGEDPVWNRVHSTPAGLSSLELAELAFAHLRWIYFVPDYSVHGARRSGSSVLLLCT
ncbi:ZFP36L1 [Symbiodinium natans]|uniref:ZFP36L1 protein n=1 Tax=Symbiodinium natans TaxID=878477 RepID=A0A812Q197_9DINO|nr:ZFP36L1 [Symbiodinium natans]